MIFFRFLRGLSARVPACDRPGRLRKALARATIQCCEASPELALSSLPSTRPPAQRESVQTRSFRSPLPSPVRIALLDGGFRLEREMREFRARDLNWLCSYAPEALVAPIDLALTLADQKSKGLFDLPSLTTAIVVLTSFKQWLSWHDRDLLWHAFGVPVFEQLRGWNGAIIARECEVHDGLHIDETAAILQLCEGELLATQLEKFGEPILRARTGLTGEILTGLCECGAETPRLRNVAGLPSKSAVAAA